MRTTSIPTSRRLRRGATIALVGASMAAAATGIGLLSAGTALAQTPRATLAVAHDQATSPDQPSVDQSPSTSAATGEHSGTATVVSEHPGSIDRPSADHHESKSATVQERSGSRDTASKDTTSATGASVTFDR